MFCLLGSLESSFEAGFQQKSMQLPYIFSHHRAQELPGSVVQLCSTLLLLYSQKKATLVKPQKEHAKTWIYLTTEENLLSLEACSQEGFAFPRLKVLQGVHLELWRSHLLMHLENRGRRQERTGGRQGPSLSRWVVCVCVSWCIFRTIL